MNVSVDFPVEVETVLRRRATAAGKDVGTIVKEFVTECLADEVPLQARGNSHREFMSKLREIIDMHPLSRGLVDDRRESIYAGRGE